MTKKDVVIDEKLAREHGLSADEFRRVHDILGRAPTYTELGIFSVMWSEHCSYKSSRIHLRNLPTSGPRVIQDTIRQELPPGFQRSEYLLEHGMVDAVVHRHKLRETLIRLVSLFMDPVTSEGRGLAVAVR